MNIRKVITTINILKMKKFLIIIIFSLSFLSPVLSESIDYKKTLLNNKIVHIYNNFAKHEFFFKKGTFRWFVTKLDTKEVIMDNEYCWFETEYINAFKFKKCVNSPSEQIFSIDLTSMTYRIEGAYDDLTYKISEPVKIYYIK